VRDVAELSDARALDRSLLHGVAWTGAAKWAAQTLSWAAWLIVARLLSPEDYGLVGMAAIYLGLVTLLSEFGLGTAVLAVRELSVRQIDQLNGLAVLLGLAGLLASCLVAVPLGRFFHAPQLPLVVVAMSTTFVITSFKTVPLALLQRDLRFKALALIDLSQALVLAISMVGFAVAGFRYWTLVCGAVLSALVSTGAILRLRHAPFAWPRPTSLTHAITLGSDVVISRLCWYASANADFLVAGRILGKAALGYYNVAWTLASIAVDKIAALVGQVTPAFFAAVQTDRAALRRYVLRITEGIALITFPVTLGLALVARDFVLVVLGAQWEGTIAPLRLLAAYAAIRSITPLLPQVLQIIRDSRFEMWRMVAAAVVMPVSFYFGGQRWGTVGLAMAWVLVDPLLTVLLYWRVFSKIELSPKAYLGALWPALSGSAFMAAVVLAVGALSGREWTAGLRLAAQVGVGAITYGLAGLALHRERFNAFYELVRAARRGSGERL
jgi:PST family polysaccharide transporter